jgi:hypothetical protein
MTLTAKEFLRRYLQHVLPQRFHKVRYYGLLSPANRVTLKRVQLLLAQRIRKKPDHVDETVQETPTTARICPCCSEGGMVIISWLPRKSRSPPSAGRS